MIKHIAILLTVFNRKEKTIACLDAIEKTPRSEGHTPHIEVFLTDDGSTDGTQEAIAEQNYGFPIHILNGNGNLYWNGGMISSWKAALKHGDFDGFLWLNNDTVMLPSFWKGLLETHTYSICQYKKGGIYVGSTYDPQTKVFTYGGFNFENRWTLKDHFIIPDGKQPQTCQCAHGNITFVSKDVVDTMGIFYDGYIHGAGDHDYTYRAYKKGFPILVMPYYVGECENDHNKNIVKLADMSLKERLAYVKSPIGYNFHNTLLFQRRCFPYRLPFVWLMSWIKIIFPQFGRNIYLMLRR